MDLKESGTQIRVPATANLMLDSDDRSSGTPDNLLIAQGASILNGFFNRIGTTEVVLNWSLPNISPSLNNNVISVTIAGAPANPYAITFPLGFYTIADVLNGLVTQLNALALGLGVFSVAQTPGGATITNSTTNFRINPTALGSACGLQFIVGLTQPTATASKYLADLTPIKYLDFVSQQLTYNQDLQDSATNRNRRNVLCRWYFSYDNPIGNDALGFPIYMGYEPFSLRRIYSPPKQIKWNPRQPVGQIDVQVYFEPTLQLANAGIQPGLLTSIYPTNLVEDGFGWLMTLQASEN